MKAVTIPRAPPAFVTLGCCGMNAPAAKAANVAVKQANKAIKAMFFLRAPISMKNVNMNQAIR